jgi:histidine phosphotransferase ChpT
MERAAGAMGSTVAAQGTEGHEAVAGDLALAATLCARVCHDLAGTIGALAGALTVATESGDAEALALAADCARDLAARLRLLRAAWGGEGDAPDPATLVAGLPGAERLRVDLSGLAAHGPAARRVAANLLLLAAESLPRGGAIALSGHDAALSLEIAGPRAAWPEALAGCLADPHRSTRDAMTARTVGVAMACRVAGQARLPIALHGATRLTAG